jgi:hypothetical protein
MAGCNIRRRTEEIPSRLHTRGAPAAEGRGREAWPCLRGGRRPPAGRGRAAAGWSERRQAGAVALDTSGRVGGRRVANRDDVSDRGTERLRGLPYSSPCWVLLGQNLRPAPRKSGPRLGQWPYWP